MMHNKGAQTRSSKRKREVVMLVNTIKITTRENGLNALGE